MTHILQPGEGEVLKLGPPLSGELMLKVDPQRSGSALVMGTWTLPPGAELPVHRHLHQETVLFVHKGQGRATVEGETKTVLPGMVINVPRQAWHGLRNTGTGLLQCSWVSTPPGVEAFFRELASAGSPRDPSAMQELAQRHGIEWRQAGEAAVPAPPAGTNRRHRRGGRGRGRPALQPQAQQARPAADTSETHAAPPAHATAATAQPSREHRNRHRRRGRGRGQAAPRAGSGASPAPSSTPRPPVGSSAPSPASRAPSP